MKDERLAEIVSEIKILRERTDGQAIRLDQLERSAKCRLHKKLETITGGGTMCIHCGQEFEALEKPVGIVEHYQAKVAPKLPGQTKHGHCPKCGYTAKDQEIHGDHHLCDGKIPE